MPLMPSTTMLLLTPTALGNSERQVVHVSLRKNVWSDGTPMRATFSTSAQATRSIIPPDAGGTSDDRTVSATARARTVLPGVFTSCFEVEHFKFAHTKKSMAVGAAIFVAAAVAVMQGGAAFQLRPPALGSGGRAVSICPPRAGVRASMHTDKV
jgi:hypothetical protein